MAYTLVGHSPSVSMVRRYVVDAYSDIETINISQLLPGSTAFVMATSKRYMLKHDGTWIEVTGSSGGGGGGGSTIYDGGDEDNPASDVIYNGGDEDG